MKKFFIRAIVLPIIFAFHTIGSTYCQLSEPIPPKSSDLLNRAALLSTTETVILPKPDLTLVRAEDLINDLDDSQPWRFAVPHYIDLSLNNSGQWEELSGGGRLWRLKIVSLEAVSLNLLYREFYLPPGATYHIYQPDKRQIRGAFTEFNNKSDRVFATALTKGESVVLEYYEPAAVRGRGAIHISTVNHGYRGYGEDNAHTGDSGNCMSDVNCSADATYQIIKRAVAKMTRNGAKWCTGTLLNNTAQDCRPLFLTANHCIDLPSPGYDAIDNPGPFNTSVFYWNFETSDCNFNQQGDDSQTTVGINAVLANPFPGPPDIFPTSSSSDFALFELAENPKSSYDVYFAGWDTTAVGSVGGAGIHHPSGDVKKISIHSLAPVSAVNDRYWRINPWDLVSGNQSVTQGGSSGSGLFRTNGKLIGQLFGSFVDPNPNCDDPANDFGDYGKLSYSWTNNGNGDAKRRLFDHLDPVGGGTTTSLAGSSNPCGMPSNVVCANAIVLDCGDDHTVNTDNATADGNPAPNDCGGVSAVSEQQGVWYRVDGINKYVSVTTCDIATDFDTKLLLYAGVFCNNLSCEDGNDDSDCGTPSILEFAAVSGTPHFIYLAGSGGATGNAKISLTCICDLPNAECRDDTVYLDQNGLVEISVEDVDNGSIADCGLDSIFIDPDTFTCEDLDKNFVLLKVFDVYGNSDLCIGDFYVFDTVSPQPLCHDITLYLDTNFIAIATPDSVDDGSTDNCLVDQLEISRDSFNCSDFGENVVTLTVTDGSDNESQCSAIVTIENDPDNDGLCCLDGEADNHHIAQLNEYMSGQFNPSGNDNGYGDYTNIVLAPSNPYYPFLYFLFLPGGTPSLHNWEMYIDWNNNELFEPAEKMMDYCTSMPFAQFINLAGRPNGLFRMRLIMQADTDNDGCQPGELPDPLCGSIGEGEVEDYMVCKMCAPPSQVADLSVFEEGENVQVFPNPFTDELMVLFEKSLDGEVEWEIVDVNGRRVKSGKEDQIQHQNQSQIQIQIQTAEIPPGLYVLKIKTESGVVAKTVIKQ